MIYVTVSYQISPKFVEQNKSNIEKFLRDFEQLENSRFTYSVFIKVDGVTFVHNSSYRDESIQKELLSVPSFLEFQKERDESGLNNTHEVDVLTLVGSTKELV